MDWLEASHDKAGKVTELEAEPLLSKKQIRLTAEDLRVWLGDQAVQLGSEQGLCLVEIWAGQDHVTKAIKQQGGNAIAIGLAYDHDLRRRRDRDLLCKLLEDLIRKMSGSAGRAQPSAVGCASTWREA